MANSKKNTTTSDKEKSNSQNTKGKNDKCTVTSNAPDQPLADMNE